MTTPDVRSIIGLRERWPEWVFEARRWYIGGKGETEYVAIRGHDYILARGSTAAEAARALDERLIALGYEPTKGE